MEYVKPEVFEAILYYIYTEKIRVREDVILDLLKLAYDYMLTGLIDALTYSTGVNPLLLLCFLKIETQHKWLNLDGNHKKIINSS